MDSSRSEALDEFSRTDSDETIITLCAMGSPFHKHLEMVVQIPLTIRSFSRRVIQSDGPVGCTMLNFDL